MDEPEVADAPVIDPVFVPNVHAKLLAALAAKLIPGPVPLHVLAVVEVVTDGLGFTVTVMVNVAPTHAPAAPEVGVTVYVTV